MGPVARERRLEAEWRFGGNGDAKLLHLLSRQDCFLMSFLFSPLLGGGFGSGWDPRAVVGKRMLPAHVPLARSPRQSSRARCLCGAGAEYRRLRSVLR